MPDILLEQVCSKCESEIAEKVLYEEEDGRITVSLYTHRCPVCGGPLKEPSPGEIRRAMILQE